MANKYLTRDDDGLNREVEATVTSTGDANAGELVALDSQGKIDPSMMPAGVGMDNMSYVASEALSANDLVNFWLDGTETKMRKADANSNKPANAFVKKAVVSGAAGDAFIASNIITGLTGLEMGKPIFLSTTAGGITQTPVTGTGKISQLVGYPASSTSFVFNPDAPIKLA